MNTGILDINASVAETYSEILSGKTLLNSKAIEIRSEMFECDDNENCDTAGLTEKPPLKHIYVIPVRGPIQRDDLLNRNNEVAVWGMDYVSRIIQSCIADQNCTAIVLEFETGGGFSNAVASVIDAIVQFKASGRMTYASVDMACSAGYHIASFCDKIYANSRSAIFGCIGTKWETIDYSKSLEKGGIKQITVVSDSTPDKGKEFDNALSGDTKLLKEHLINPIGQHFKDDVIMNRPGIDEKMIQGYTLSAQLAIDAKMADGIMSLSEIIKGITTSTMPKTKSSKSTTTNSFTNQINSEMDILEFLGLTKSKAPDELANNPQLVEIKNSIAGFQTTIATQTGEISSKTTEITGLKSQLDAEKTALASAQTELAKLKSENDAYLAKLEVTAGAAPKTAVLNATGELIEEGKSRYEDATIDDEIKKLQIEAQSRIDRSKSLLS